MTDEKYTENGRLFYKATGNRVWPRRNREFPEPGEKHEKPLIENERVRRLFEQLDRLEKKTRPSGGEETAAGKDLAAFRALKIACDLVRHVAGWAIDHQIGLATKEMGFVPRGTPQVEAHLDYTTARDIANGHDNERIGGSVTALEPIAERTALVNLLRANPGGFPQAVQRPAIEALEALSFEEVLPMLAPAQGDRKVKLMELRMQLQVVGFIAFQVASGLDRTKYKAIERASGILKTAGENTIRGWEFRLRKELGPLVVARTQALYESRGHAYKEEAKQLFAGDINASPQDYLDNYGVPALEKLAVKYGARKK
jgi:hypothetical protein